MFCCGAKKKDKTKKKPKLLKCLWGAHPFGPSHHGDPLQIKGLQGVRRVGGCFLSSAGFEGECISLVGQHLHTSTAHKPEECEGGLPLKPGRVALTLNSHNHKCSLAGAFRSQPAQAGSVCSKLSCVKQKCVSAVPDSTDGPGPVLRPLHGGEI